MAATGAIPGAIGARRPARFAGTTGSSAASEGWRGAARLRGPIAPGRYHRCYSRRVQFGRWYPLADAPAHAPAGPGVFQVRARVGLIDYPRGKSAMVAYRHAHDARATARELAAAYAGDDLLCRHLIERDEATDLAAFCAKLRAEFVRRFGRAPIHDP